MYLFTPFTFSGAMMMGPESMAGEPETDLTDQAALLMMLSYVEAECLRLGATEAARHAALAAAMMPTGQGTEQFPAVRPPAARLH